MSFLGLKDLVLRFDASHLAEKTRKKDGKNQVLARDLFYPPV
jgi:hypothetical protein